MEKYRVEASFEDLMLQASTTTEDYMLRAVKIIDKELGTGYASNNPGLVGDMVQAMATDFSSSTRLIASQMQREALSSIAIGIDELGVSVGLIR